MNGIASLLALDADDVVRRIGEGALSEEQLSELISVVGDVKSEQRLRASAAHALQVAFASRRVSPRLQSAALFRLAMTAERAETTQLAYACLRALPIVAHQTESAASSLVGYVRDVMRRVLTESPPYDVQAFVESAHAALSQIESVKPKVDVSGFGLSPEQVRRCKVVTPIVERCGSWGADAECA